MKEQTLKNEKGFTLIELMISGFIVTVLFASVFTVVSMANQVFRTNDLYSRLNQNALQVMRSISREIGQTSPNASPSHLSISTDASSNSIIRFQIPVDWDNDGDADSGGANPAIEWGAYDNPGEKTNGRLDGWIQYSVSNNQLIRSVLTSGLSTVAGLDRVVANNVTSFTTSQSSNVLTMTISFQVTDTVGQKSTQIRTFSQTFSNVTILRNAVN